MSQNYRRGNAEGKISMVYVNGGGYPEKLLLGMGKEWYVNPIFVASGKRKGVAEYNPNGLNVGDRVKIEYSGGFFGSPTIERLIVLNEDGTTRFDLNGERKEVEETFFEKINSIFIGGKFNYGV